ncbi:MAG: ABC transporter substrate-binding protein [Thiohalophilus sp.]|nr:ABC transporter substrate-binding protein [Thiohalophilus sp.]MDZ7663226.1 ABC transporter substrate-binding protein [Thiohalophilus sp.]
MWNNPYPDSEADANILYASFSERPKHLDPVQSYSSNEYQFLGQIYEPPLQYHYLKRPYELEPLTAAQMPRVTYLDTQDNVLPEDASPAEIAYSVYEITIKPGIEYQPHPAFATDKAGKPLYRDLGREDLAEIDVLGDFAQTATRELTAGDYVYQIKRLAHPRVHSPIFGVMKEYIVGLGDYADMLREAYREQAAAQEEPFYFDLNDYPLEGVQQVDRYTYRIKVKGKYPQLRYWLAMPFFAPMPHEAVEFYSQPGMKERNLSLDWYPVGTGAYYLTINDPNRKMVLERNPHFHEQYYPTEGEAGDREQGLLEDAGKRLPFIDKVVFSLEKESIPYWSKFLQGYYDASSVINESFDQAIQFTAGGEARLTPEMRDKGIELLTEAQASTIYIGFNMLDSLVGGDSRRARLLRRAISIAVDMEEYISIFLNGRGIAAQSPLPPGIFGHKSGREGVNPYVYEWRQGRAQRRSIDEAKALLAEAGYPNGVEKETGKPLLINFDITGGGPEDKARFDWLRKQLKKIDVQLIIRNTDYNRFQEKMRKGNAQLFMWGWNADYPDPENFMFLLHGPNGKAKHNGENAANYDNPEFNRLFNQMRNMQNSPKRAAIIENMLEIARRDAPWIWGFHPKQFLLHHAWYQNVKPNLMAHNTMMYKRIDPQLRQQRRQQWNQPVVWPVVLLAMILLISLIPAIIAYRRRELASGREAN